MIFAAPFLLAGLAVLPLLWWLLRALPPSPRVQVFPAIRLLAGLTARMRDARRVPPWLLALRLLAVALLVTGLAQPVLVGRAPKAAAQAGPLLLAIDDGWAAAPDWAARLGAADDALDRAARAGRMVMLLRTAPDRTGAAPALSAPLPAADIRARLEGAAPRPWPVDRAAAARAVRQVGAHAQVLYLADGLAAAGGEGFAQALRAVGPVTELRGRAPVAVPGRPVVTAGGLSVPLLVLQSPLARSLVLRGETQAGSVLARAAVDVPPGATGATASLALPAELRNQLSRLTIEQVAGAGAVRLLDEGDRRRPVGLLTEAGADTPLLGALFYLRRALSPTAELREGTLDALLGRQLSVLVAPDGTLSSRSARDKVAAWVRHGGMLIRFAGPRLAADTMSGPGDGPGDAPGDGPGSNPGPDPLLPATLLGGARQLGGAMSWGHPEHPAAFPAGSPFAGLAIPAEVTVSRQVLAEPSADLGDKVWGRLADGTPLVTHAPLGDGQLVLFHVTSTADWSNLPLSGLFPQMLQRLVQRAAGLSTPGDKTLLAPASCLSGDGQLGPPPPAAQALESNAFGATPASATHPAGLYGPLASRRSLNIADALPPLRPEPAIGALRDLAGDASDHPLGPSLLAAALALLVADLIATLALRGLIRVRRPGGPRRAGLAALALLPALAACLAACLAPHAAAAQAQTQTQAQLPGGALETRLAYVVTGDAATDTVSREGLQGLSRYANARTSARLGEPDGVVPGRDDLAFYPLLYWPVTPATVTAPPSPAWVAALNGYMNHGGILMIDTQGAPVQQGGQQDGAGQDGGYVPVVPGTRQALRLATGGLEIPALAIAAPGHVLNRTFYLLHGMPGRYAGAPVWVAGAEDAGNDGVSPMILGANDWAAAWAVDPSGQNPYAAIPGGEDQRVAAYRFGVNAVIYALTGNYKTDQVHVPALLKRLGQDGGRDPGAATDLPP